MSGYDWFIGSMTNVVSIMNFWPHDCCPKKVLIPNAETSNTTTNVGKQNVRYEPKASTSALKKTTTNVGNVSNSSSLLKNMVNSPNQDNITSSNSFAALNKDIKDEEEFENVFDETANLFNSKTGGRSSFTAVVG
ncbi:hypothetical protein Tco_0912324 [Tanacetum coccineum]